METPGSRTILSTFTVAYVVGAMSGLGAAGIEWLAGGGLMTSEGAAVYSLIGGLLASVLRCTLGLRVGPAAARFGALSALAIFGSLYLLYFVNVKVLPGEPYNSARSIAADLVVLAVILPAAFWLARSPRARQARERWGTLAVGLLPILLLGCGSVLIARWPAPPAAMVRNGAGPDLLLVVMDSVRRDRVGLYGSGRLTSPMIDGLAGRGRVYESAYAASSWTVPSVSEILGLGLVTASPDKNLAEKLVAQGYVTACFTDNPHLARGRPLVRGFDLVGRSVGLWRRIFRGTVVGEVIERLDAGDDRLLADRALEWAAQQKGPFFLYVHLMNAHTPYRQPPFDGKRRGGRRVVFPFSGMRMTTEEQEDVVARYEGGVRSADAAAGELVTKFASRGRPFLAVVTADHGESLGESGRWFHGGTLAPELLAIPLLMLGEGVHTGRVKTPVGHEAILPTLLAAAGLPCPTCSGPDLRADAGDGIIEGALPPDLIYRITPRFKLVLDRHDKSQHLFDLLGDPQESGDIASERPDLATNLAEGLALRASGPEHTPIPADLRERLRALGYTQ